ncbi:MAG: AtpZ/AtpI family protein [Fimbriimonadales bacterium]|jgi:hypothetical protein|nr:AtpZ/AtpI family protein [Fimbriimonadales bacterium]GBC91118.1 hypothetical protein HRbin14_01876 [bacterium HR14]GIV12266.1 MAG: hypothetical protein KatS3mg021_0548 [Fimbriimonadales bacterium]CUU00852.1 Putative F0F1-ATPase subunit Ca2+/Mg2+ transporter [Armatimonadetes bacterium GBS]CUU36881.1 Putative F0F1-ATPase subunit Ca2+/Mg2+ transporter [Armatimonadetes bacterium GXS]
MSDLSKPPPSEEPEVPEVPPRPELPEVPEVHFERPKLPSGPSPGFQQGVKAMSLAFSIGFALAGPVILGGLVGYWLDSRLNTSPTWTLILVLLGTVAGFVQLIRMVNKMNE